MQIAQNARMDHLFLLKFTPSIRSPPEQFYPHVSASYPSWILHDPTHQVTKWLDSRSETKYVSSILVGVHHNQHLQKMSQPVLPIVQ